MSSNNMIKYNTSSPDMGDYFKEGFNLFKQSAGTFIVASILFWVVSIASFSILFGPLLAGYMLIFVEKIRGKDVKVFDIFKGFNRFIPIVIVFYLTKAIIGIGFFFLIIPGLIFISWFFFVELLILDKNIGVFEAMKLNKRMSSKRGIWNYVILNVILVSILSILGGISFGIGTVLITPLVFAIYAVAYEDAFGEQIVEEI
ncbi:MAG TPA: hypothetical protein C5S51_07130 [Methanosarcinaceae archaeon]|nr:hypothetical protein [Methanosarcinaceae archaeon]